MTFEELKKRCDTIGIPFAFGKFKDEQSPPFLLLNAIGSNNFGADNIVYLENEQKQLELVTKEKDLELEKKIKEQVLYDTYWEDSEGTHIDDQEVYNISYFFN